MKRSLMACAWLLLAAALAACRSNGDNMFTAHDKTVEYYRVFDIRTDASAATVARAASTGVERNLKDAVIATPPTPPVGEVPGRFRMAAPGDGAATAPAPAGVSSCEGASWTAKAVPVVRGGENMNLVACLFPYRSGYHLDMYAVFTKPEGGWLAWPRQLGGTVLGTPEKFTEATMMDLVRAIREGTGANVSLVEAKPELAGAPWLGAGTRAQVAAAPAGAPAALPSAAPAPPAVPAAPATPPTPAPPATAPPAAAPPAVAPPAAPALPAAATIASAPSMVPAVPATPLTASPAPAAAAPVTTTATASPVPSPGTAPATIPDALR